MIPAEAETAKLVKNMKMLGLAGVGGVILYALFYSFELQRQLNICHSWGLPCTINWLSAPILVCVLKCLINLAVPYCAHVGATTNQKNMILVSVGCSLFLVLLGFLMTVVWYFPSFGGHSLAGGWFWAMFLLILVLCVVNGASAFFGWKFQEQMGTGVVITAPPTAPLVAEGSQQGSTMKMEP